MVFHHRTPKLFYSCMGFFCFRSWRIKLVVTVGHWRMSLGLKLTDTTSRCRINPVESRINMTGIESYPTKMNQLWCVSTGHRAFRKFVFELIKIASVQVGAQARHRCASIIHCRHNEHGDRRLFSFCASLGQMWFSTECSIAVCRSVWEFIVDKIVQLVGGLCVL